MALLEVNALGAGYGDLQVVWDVSLKVEPGQLSLVLGRNGVGKTTTLRAIAGLQRTSAGSILFEGQDISGVAAHARVPLGLSMVQENKRIFRLRSVEQNLQIGGISRKVGRRELKSAIEEIFQRFPILREKRSQRAGALSGGQQQMLAIGQALIARPKILMLDEPSAGLAPIVMDEILAVIESLKSEGIGILLVEQVIERALPVADEVFVIDHGRLVTSGPATDFEDSEILREIYLGRKPEKADGTSASAPL